VGAPRAHRLDSRIGRVAAASVSLFSLSEAHARATLRGSATLHFGSINVSEAGAERDCPLLL